MEYCPSSLKQERLEKGQYSESDIRKLLREVCLGLRYIHRQEVVHLDIKPGMPRK